MNIYDILSSLVHSLSNVFPHIKTYPHIFLYDTPYQALTLASTALIFPKLLYYQPQDLKFIPRQLVNQLLDDYIHCHFLNFTLVFTDVFVGASMAGYATPSW